VNPGPLRLLLVRHGETEVNREGRMQGGSDAPLNARGRAQARALARALAGEPLTAVYASPLRRAWETALLLAEPHRLEPVPLEGLRELDAGLLDGLTGEEVRRRFPRFLERWRADPATTPTPGGESLGRLQERAVSALEEVLRRHRTGTLALVAHYFTASVLLCYALDLPLTAYRQMRLDLGAYAVLEVDARGKGALLALNRRCHLKGLAEG